MVERLFDPLAILVILGLGILAGVIGAIVAATRGESWTVAIEVALLTAVGAFLARSLISIMLSLGHDSAGAGVLLGWGFFLWPGAIDTIAGFFGAQLLTTPDRLLWIAVGVGAFFGFVDGMRRVRSADLAGAGTFLLDTTWGLAGTTNASLLHIFNTFAGKHEDDGRRNVHRYSSGFHVKEHYAFTQGSVMSELSDGPEKPDKPLYWHERTHVSQNRAFGPLFPLSYIGWAVVMFVPGLIAAAIRKAPARDGIEAWSYYNNPWETWGYKVQENLGDGPRTGFGPMVWSDLAVLIVAIVYFAIFLLIAWLLVSAVWL